MINKVSDRRSLSKTPVLITSVLALLSTGLILAIIIPLMLNDLRGVTAVPSSTPTVVMTKVVGEYLQPTSTPPVLLFASLEAGQAQIGEDGAALALIEAGAEVLRLSGQNITSLTTCTFDLQDTSALVMTSDSIIEQTEFQSGSIILRLGKILVANFSLTVVSPDAQYQVKGREAVMGIEYDPASGRFWVECLAGDCYLLDDPSIHIRAGQAAGYANGEYQTGKPVDYAKWADLYPDSIKLPTATHTSTQKPTSTSTPTP